MTELSEPDTTADSSKQRNPTNYRVELAPPPARALAPQIDAGIPVRPECVAVFVAHGMGQQIRFETLDTIAEALRRYDVRKTGNRNEPFSKSLKYDDKLRLERIELKLESGGGEVDVHVYEGYWAPLTEGKIDARKVIAFLAGGAGNGLKIARGKFRRWVFGEYHQFATPFRSIVYLLVALATVASLVTLNTAIGAVAAARALLGQSPAWLTAGLFADLTTTFNVVVTAMVAFALLLGVSNYMRRLGWSRRVRVVWGSVTAIAFAAALVIVILAGLAVALLFYSHVRGGTAPATELWSVIFPHRQIARFNLRFGFWALWVTFVFVGLRLLWWVGELALGFLGDVTNTTDQALRILLTIFITGAFVGLVALLIWLVEVFAPYLSGSGLGTASLGSVTLGLAGPVRWLVFSWLLLFALIGSRNDDSANQENAPRAGRRLWTRRSFNVAISLISLAVAGLMFVIAYRVLHNAQGSGGPGFDAFERTAAWPLLIALSAYVRSVLVQYVGDVAIYVSPYKLDAFNDLRKEIKEAVYNVAHAVYSLRDGPTDRFLYDKVIVLGHSLGSVIAYDALNRLILEDKDPAAALDIVRRTPLFLTFGSPLDKTAFIFGAQGHGTTEAREALAAAVQPLIQDYSYRPEKWINIYSPWDIISGSLDLYDLEPTDSKKVDNIPDPDATTLLMAHTEYWNNELLVKTLYDALTIHN
jgi:hypothetical protein